METAILENTSGMSATLTRYEAYKDSGVEWLGKIPAHWEVKKVTHLFNKIGSGTTPISGDKRYYDGGINWLQTGDLTDGLITYTSKKITERAIAHFSALKIYPKGSLVIAMYGATIGKVGLLNIDTATNQACCILSSPNSINIKYIFFWFINAKRNIISMGYGGGQPNISQDLIKSLRLPVPPLEEQARITNFLDQKTAQIDQAIAQKERLIALLQERRQVMIHQAVTRGLSPDVPMKNSRVEWIGEIPAHWEIVSNRSLFAEKNESGNDTLPILSVSIHTAVSSEELDETENAKGGIRIQDKSSYKKVDSDDIVFNMMRAWQGAIGAVRTSGMVSPAYIVAKSLGKINTEFFEHQYRIPAFIQQMDRFSKGITDFRKRLYWNEFKQLKTLLPPIEDQLVIAQFINDSSVRIATAISQQEKAISMLKEYRTTLINSAVTGKIKVP